MRIILMGIIGISLYIVGIASLLYVLDSKNPAAIIPGILTTFIGILYIKSSIKALK